MEKSIQIQQKKHVAFCAIGEGWFLIPAERERSKNCPLLLLLEDEYLFTICFSRVKSFVCLPYLYSFAPFSLYNLLDHSFVSRQSSSVGVTRLGNGQSRPGIRKAVWHINKVLFVMPQCRYLEQKIIHASLWKLLQGCSLLQFS